MSFTKLKEELISFQEGQGRATHSNIDLHLLDTVLHDCHASCNLVEVFSLIGCEGVHPRIVKEVKIALAKKVSEGLRREGSSAELDNEWMLDIAFPQFTSLQYEEVRDGLPFRSLLQQAL